jgi:protein TonB
MTHLFLLWFALFAAQATIPATPPPSEPPATQPTQPAAAATPSTSIPVQAVPTCNNCPIPVVQHVQPFIAKSHITNVQTRADGTTVTTVTEEQILRDADGRRRGDNIRTMPNGAPSHFISIYDPVTRIIMSWNVGDSTADKIVTVRHLTQPVSQPTPITPQTAPSTTLQNIESLPPQTILGLTVPGIRRTSTIPAGHQGNDHDVTITTDFWYSQTLDLQLRNITDDPINGKTTQEITSIQLVDPDPALFQPPVDYQLKEVTPPSPNPDSSKTNQSGGKVTPPRIIYQPNPVFSMEAELQNITGVTVVQIIVNTEGKPENVHVTKSIADTVDSKHRAAALTLDQKAVDAVKQYRFKPAMQDGKPVAVYLNVNVNFQLGRIF